ncbi:unnamed protein product, partial [Vitis vinifera]
MVGLLKLLKPVLDDVVNCKIPSDEILFKECEELDMAVNEAREFVENWCPKMSKIFSVLQSEQLVMKIQSSSLEICFILCRLLHSSPSVSNLTSIQHCMQKLQHLEQKRISEYIEQALRTYELDQINQIVELVSHIRDCMVRLGGFEAINGVRIPSYFRCPLSLELMMDPVIVASGQTYERSSIQKWLDQGLMICPKTRQTLAHANLIPNYTVKALIENWCEENNITLSGTSEHTNITPVPSPLDHVSAQDVIGMDSFLGNLKSWSDNPLNSHIFTAGLNQPQVLFPVLIPYLPRQLNLEMVSNGKCGPPRILSLPFSDPKFDDLTTSSHVEKLVEDLKSQSNELQTVAASELRLLAKHNMENRIIIGRCGAIAPLVLLLYSEVKQTQENAVTALLNLSINDANKVIIAEAGAIESLIHVLKSGNAGAKENSAATLFSLSVLEEYKAKIGCSGAVKALVDLLGSGTLRGKKDAATALFNLSICHENKPRIIQAGAVKYLVQLMEPATGMVDKAVALLANLSIISEGRFAIVREGGIPLLVELVETGSVRGKENAASILLQLCINSPKFCTLVLQEGAIPPLVALSQSGTPRAKEKAQQLLSHFRNQREGAAAKGKS